MIVGVQVRMARSALRWTVKQLAEHAGVGISTVQRVEAAEGVPNATAANLSLIEKALTQNGVVFIPADEELGPGVRLTHETA